MIHEIGKELQAKLRAKGCPFNVLDRETTKPSAWKNAIVIERTPDTTGTAKSQSFNPKRYYTRNIGGKLTVYAQSAKPGALPFEHERVADQVVDLSLVALRKVAADRKQPITFGRGEFVKIADLERSERPAGAVYELEFTIEHGVADLSWIGEASPEATLSLISMTGNPDLTFVAADHTVTRSDGSWVDDGFAVGVTVRVRESASNNVDGEITEVTPTVLTLGATSLADEGPVSGCTVVAGGVDNCTHVVFGNSPTETACGDC